jgi:hypothetical protein
MMGTPSKSHPPASLIVTSRAVSISREFSAGSGADVCWLFVGSWFNSATVYFLMIFFWNSSRVRVMENCVGNWFTVRKNDVSWLYWKIGDLVPSTAQAYARVGDAWLSNVPATVIVRSDRATKSGRWREVQSVRM